MGNNAGPVHRAGLPLTDCQRRVLAAIVRGERQYEIAQRLGLSIKTVGDHVEHAKARLGARTTRQAIAMYAVEEALESVAGG